MAPHDSKHKERQERQPAPGWRGRIWLEGEAGTFIGYGRAVLLERIREYGSISKAAQAMEMSYKHAWDLVKSMQEQAGEPLVATSRGGRGGGGAQLTRRGDELLAAFWAMQQRFDLFLADETTRWRQEQGDQEE
jgi:molybdate transport system regulatory protein